jgi:hypothetical protein
MLFKSRACSPFEEANSVLQVDVHPLIGAIKPVPDMLATQLAITSITLLLVMISRKSAYQWLALMIHV